MIKGLCFAGGVVFGIVLTCVACGVVQPANYNNGRYTLQAAQPVGPSIASATPIANQTAISTANQSAISPSVNERATSPSPRHPAISKSIDELQDARSALATEAANDYQGHKGKAIAYIDHALAELRICLSMR